MNHVLSFCAVIGIQFLVFLLIAYRKQAFKTLMPAVILQSALAGAVFGVPFDLVMGKGLGIFTYALPFSFLFLLINGLFSYGLWFLTLYLLKGERLLPFFGWTILMGFLYEVADYFFPVWSWTFGSTFIYRESVVILFAYCGLGILTALSASLLTRTKFRAFTL